MKKKTSDGGISVDHRICIEGVRGEESEADGEACLSDPSDKMRSNAGMAQTSLQRPGFDHPLCRQG